MATGINGRGILFISNLRLDTWPNGRDAGTFPHRGGPLP